MRCKFFSVVDLVNGYQQVPMHPANIKKKPSSHHLLYNRHAKGQHSLL
jgi:hypothetical protein